MRKRLLLPAGLVLLLLTLLLALALQGFARDVLLVELVRAYWEVRTLFESLPQVAVWAVLLVALLAMAARSLYRGRRPSQESPREERATPGQVWDLALQIQHASKGDYFKWSLARYLGDLACEIMARQQRATAEQLRRRLRAGTLELPPAIRGYLEYGRGPLSVTPAGLLSRLRARRRSGAPPYAPDPPLEQVVEFLEERLTEGSGGST